ncbi:MAG TPA: metallophosphoesterase [Acidimicrobiales bacterium]|nr:metallophosphoesterase [Acidimicrobiales bacterium]
MEVFAVEHDSIQLTWGRLPAAEMTIEIDGRSFEVGNPPPDWYRVAWRQRLPRSSAGPGALSVRGLSPATTYDVLLTGSGHPRKTVARVRTMEAPPGRLLSRFATISDCHFGERSFAPLKLFHDPRPRPEGLDPYTIRCALGAIGEAQDWGAEMIIAKGDLTQNARHTEVGIAVRVLAQSEVPIAIALGNHDVRGPLDSAALLREAGFEASSDASFRDIPGVRVVLGHSPLPDRHAGGLPESHIAEVAALAGGEPAGGGRSRRTVSDPPPAVIVLHHPLRRWPVETHYPPSVNWRDSRKFASAVLAANRSSVVLSGHTHRNRMYRAGGLLVSEVGSTKDYPGQWAGYSVYEGGIRQVVRRIERPDAIAWNQMTKRALGGVWGRWSPGSIGDRCWTLHWPDRVERAGD